jgi:hypothetical protein
MPSGNKMISAQLRGISTSEGDDLARHIPENPQDFSVLVRVLVGPHGGEGEESFDINVCTPQWLKDQVRRDGSVLGLHRLFIDSYDPPRIKTLITKLMERNSGESWRDVAEKISRIAHWEFEDYNR